MRRQVILIVAPLALAAAAIGLVWWAPWSMSADPVTRAREALGNRPVLHVVARSGILPGAAPTRSVVDETEWEVWLDLSRGLVHVIERRGGKARADVAVSRLTAASFPLAKLEPLLGDFVALYPPELVGRQLRAAGSGTIQGRRVLWLRSALMRVAVDPASYRALWVSSVAGGKPSGELVQIVLAETLPFASGNFRTRRTTKPRHL